MSNVFWRIARYQQDVDTAQGLRWRCLVEEQGIAVTCARRVRRDVSDFDNLETTFHILVYAENEPVGTVRLALPSSDGAAPSRGDLGLELGQTFDLSELSPRRDRVGEISRFCALARHRGTHAVIQLYEGLYVLSKQLGLEYWVGGVDCQTSCRADARLMRRVLEDRGAIDDSFHVSELGCTADLDDPGAGHPFYAQEDHTRAARGGFAELRVAPRLETFMRRLGARSIGSPGRHPVFDRCVMPMLTVLDAIPTATLAHFDLTQQAPVVRRAASLTRDDNQPLRALEYVG